MMVLVEVLGWEGGPSDQKMISAMTVVIVKIKVVIVVMGLGGGG